MPNCVEDDFETVPNVQCGVEKLSTLRCGFHDPIVAIRVVFEHPDVECGSKPALTNGHCLQQNHRVMLSEWILLLLHHSIRLHSPQMRRFVTQALL